MRYLSLALFLTATVYFVPLSAQAQNTCATSTLSGTYVYVLSGNVYSAADGQYLPYAEVGKFTADGSGVVSGQSTASNGIAIAALAPSGSYSVLGNCGGTMTLSTGALTLQITSGGQSVMLASSSLNYQVTGQAYRSESVAGGQCASGSLSGTYGYQMSGLVSNSNGTYYYSAAGQIAADGNGNLTTTDVYDQGGQVQPESGSGTYTVNGDCMGTAQFVYPGRTLNYNIALGAGNNLLFLETDETTTVQTAVSGAGQRQSVGSVLPQFVFGSGVWYSALYFTNSNSNSVSFTVNFTADGGTPLVVPSLGGSSVAVTLAPNGTKVLEAPNSGSFGQGYASVVLPPGVTGYGIFRQSVPGRPDQEAVVPLASGSSTTSTLAWDETGGAVVSLAIANPSAVATNVTITVWGTSGNLLGASPPVSLAPNSKIENTLDALSGLSLAGNRGSAQFTVSQGKVAVLGLRFVGVAFTSIPAAGN